MKTFVLRGLGAGASGGLATALFLRFVIERQIGWAIDLENASGLGLPPGEADMFSRSTQHWGAVIAAIIYGAVIGVVLGVVVALLHGTVRSRDEFGRVAKVAAAAFLATGLLPALKYPANPPTAGNPDTIGQRTAAYLSLMIVLVVIMVLARLIWIQLIERGLSGGARFLLGGSAFALMITAAFLIFPPSPDRIEPPNNEGTPALVVANDAPPAVLDAMLANARTTGDGSYRDPKDTDQALNVSKVSQGSDLVGTPVAISATKLTPHVYTTLIWSFRMWSLAGIALMWAVIAGVLGLLLDRAAAPDDGPTIR